MPSPSDRGFGWFAVSIASWFGAWGMQVVLFSWLVVGELRASPEWVGICQTALLLPSLVLLLVGGDVADRREPRRLLSALHALATLPVLLLAAVVATGNLAIPWIIAYGICIGTISAFTIKRRVLPRHFRAEYESSSKTCTDCPDSS